jgi:hypothetical protein
MTPDARAWVDAAVASITAEPAAIRALFPAVGRRCGREPIRADDPQGLVSGTVDDAVRAELLTALPLSGDELVEEVENLYRFGDAAEKRGVLRALPSLDVGDRGVSLVLDGLRANDIRLVAAAMSSYAATHLSDDEWRQALMKCLFVGVPFAAVADVDSRTDAELVRMMVGLAEERVAAGRDVPADIWPLAERFPDVIERSSLAAELSSPVPERAAAARRALDGRDAVKHRAEA